MAVFIPVDAFDIVIFGGTGDLSKRKLIPALFHRYLDGQIDSACNIIGLARTEQTRDDFIAFARAACQDGVDNWDVQKWEGFAALIDYVRLDVLAGDSNWQPLKSRLKSDGRPCIFYLATTPLIYVDICEALGREDMVTSNARLVLEKPIGKDLSSAQTINEGVGAIFAEQAIYRIDHYLGKETVQNLLALRFANALLDPVWNRNSIDHVQITVAEDVGVEGRANYYDRSGAVRDMIQNHLLQLLCLTAMEPPNSLDAEDVRLEKMKVLKALKIFSRETVLQNTVRGQYEGGGVDGQWVKSYQETLGEQDNASQTETFAAVKAEIENARWAGVPFYLRTGKRMKARRSTIMIQFKATPHPIFDSADRVPNRLVMRLQPDEGMRLFIQVKEPGPGGMRLKYLPLDLSYAENFTVRYPDAYERLLMDVVRGNLALFMSRAEVEAAWVWVDNLLSMWDHAHQPLQTYAAGTQGPMQAAMLMDRDGREWWES